MSEIAEHQWRIFTPNNQTEHVRIHYMCPDGSTSAGFVEQREKKEPLRTRVQYFVTFNGNAHLQEQPVDTLRQGMDIIEWLVREKGESK